MPQITDYKTPKKFIKKSYRPWNILEEIKKENPALLDNNVKNNELEIVKQLDSKLPANYQQTNSDITSKLPANYQQTNSDITSKLPANYQQTNSDITSKLPANYQQTNSDITSKLPANYQQTNSDITSKLPAINRLYGLQKDIFIFLINRIIDDFVVITSEELKQISDTSIKTLRNALDRLIDKGFFVRKKGKEGRGGFLILLVSEFAKKAFEEEEKERDKKTTSKLPANYQQIDSTPPPVSSSIYINKTTTTLSDSAREIVDNFSFPDEWEEIDIEPLAFIKFTKAHLDQIYKAGKISPDLLQASIHSFAFDLQVNDKAKVLKLSPINVFMGMMKKGSPYLPPENYESPEEQVMKAYLDAMKKKADRIRKLEEECKTLALQEWRDGLSEDEQKAIVPEKYHAASEKKIFESLIIAHFEKKIWQSIKPTKKISTLAI